MKFDPPLTQARLERRYKRFFADVCLADNTVVTVHCPNPGSMMGLAQPGWRVWLSRHSNPKRKLPWSWEVVETDTGVLVGVHTSRANDLVHEALLERNIRELSGFRNIEREVRVSEKSRVDFLLTEPKTYVEVKSVTLSRSSGLAEFPDAKTMRGVRHLKELSNLVAQGHRAVMLYVVQREDCEIFAFAEDIDPAYSNAMKEGVRAGVEILCYKCAISTTGIRVLRKIPVVIP